MRSALALLRWCVTAAFLPIASAAQSADPDTLADIRQELEVLYVMVQGLKRELATTQSPGILNAQGSFQERIDAIEFALQRLTARTEELENRVERVVADGTMRIGDLEFRLVELEGGDIGALGTTTTLGGDPTTSGPTMLPPATEDSQLAIGEKHDFDLALEAYEAEDFVEAERLFALFNDTYPAGPLAGAAHLYRGLALDAQGLTGDSARAYLEAFSVSPDGPEAPMALYQLGLSLNALGQASQACVTLSEVGVRFPGDPMVPRADNARRQIGCP